jgi:HSP20 family protein
MSLERRFDEVTKGLLGTRARPLFGETVTGLMAPFAPTADVFEREGKLVVHLDVPGIDISDVEVHVSDDQLVITGERKKTEEVKQEDYYRMESSYGSFERRFPLYGEVDPKDIAASYKDGVLEVTMPLPPKEEVPEAKRIPIEITEK